jgi:hypothetical protein
MIRTSPAVPAAVCALNVAGWLEVPVGDAATFLPIIEQNKRKIFEQLDKIQFV